MLASFKHKGLKELFETGRTTRINTIMHARIIPRLDAIDNAAMAEDLKLPGFNFHPLLGHVPVRYAIHVNGPWCITFEFENGNAYRVDFEQYH